MAIRTRAAGFRIGATKAFGLWRSMIVSGFFICPEWLLELRVRFHKEGSTKMSKHSMICAGIDTGKRKLDVALDERAEQLQVDNTADGHVAFGRESMPLQTLKNLVNRDDGNVVTPD